MSCTTTGHGAANHWKTPGISLEDRLHGPPELRPAGILIDGRRRRVEQVDQRRPFVAQERQIDLGDVPPRRPPERVTGTAQYRISLINRRVLFEQLERVRQVEI